ncbi:hypothetical protein CCACVL1_00281, partial [Corchorus capsularis]
AKRANRNCELLRDNDFMDIDHLTDLLQKSINAKAMFK